MLRTISSLARTSARFLTLPLTMVAPATVGEREGIGDLVEDSLEALGEVVEDSLDVLNEVVEDGVGLVEDTLGTHRRVWADEADHAQIELRGAADPGPSGCAAPPSAPWSRSRGSGGPRSTRSPAAWRCPSTAAAAPWSG